MTRIMELAREQAFVKHAHFVLMTNPQGHVRGMNDKEWGFTACPHPDCVLVRADAAASRAPNSTNESRSPDGDGHPIVKGLQGSDTSATPCSLTAAEDLPLAIEPHVHARVGSEEHGRTSVKEAAGSEPADSRYSVASRELEILRAENSRLRAIANSNAYAAVVRDEELAAASRAPSELTRYELQGPGFLLAKGSAMEPTKFSGTKVYLAADVDALLAAGARAVPSDERPNWHQFLAHVSGCITCQIQTDRLCVMGGTLLKKAEPFNPRVARAVPPVKVQRDVVMTAILTAVALEKINIGERATDALTCGLSPATGKLV